MQSIIEEKNVRDYILSEEIMRELRKPVVKQQKRKKPTPKVNYRVILQAGCDFIVEKQKGNNVQQLVILVSQRQYYIHNADGKMELLTATNLKAFLSDAEGEIMLPEITWLSGLRAERGFAGRMIKYLRYDKTVGMIRKNLFYLYNKVDGNRWFGGLDFWNKECSVSRNNIFNSSVMHPAYMRDEDYMAPLQEHISAVGDDGWGDIFNTDFLFEENSNIVGSIVDERDSLKESYSEIMLDCYTYEPAFYNWLIDYMANRRGISRKELYEKYLFEQNSKEMKVMQSYFAFLTIIGFMGMQWGKKAVMIYLDSGVEDILPVNQICGMFTGKNHIVKCNGVGYYRSLCCIRKFKADSFLKYLFDEAVRQGFADDLHSFLFIWNEVLAMQEKLDGRTNDKYPKYLVSSHCKLAFDCRKYDSRTKEDKWNKVVSKMQAYEYKNERFQIICPKNGSDLVKESRVQHNCVNGYEDRILDGKEMILFLRKNERPDQSLVTIELFYDGNLGQMFGGYNMEPTVEEMEFIKEWAKVKNLRIPEVPVKPME
ncbi:MAG: PcfJ domain-containing protein [Lachnospiraceae bacterium]|nr:PcfJ domain-containing protein [Lachnospiraceae bacterium]